MSNKARKEHVEIKTDAPERAEGAASEPTKVGNEKRYVGGETGTFSRADVSISAAQNSGPLPWYKRTFFRKLRYALIALLIALTLWGYVLMTENPARIKRVEGVRLSFVGGSEADLKARGLIISGDIESILSDVTVNVRTTLTDLPRFNSAVNDIVTATISISDIREPGTYTRRIMATSTIGTPESVEPSTITITVENLVKRQIPVTCTFVNELPEGYWHDEPRLMVSSTSTDMLDIQGPESVISSITSATCVIDLSGRTKSIYESFPLQLLDADDQVVDASALVDVLPVASVRMTILPYLELPLGDYVKTVGELSEYFDINSITISPSILTLAAPESTLDELAEKIYIEPINAGSFTEPGTYTFKVSVLGLPSDVTLLTDNNFIITVDVTDKVLTRSFNMQLTEANFVGEDASRFSYQYNTRSCYVQLVGPARFISDVTEDDLHLVVDVSGLEAGAHELTPELSVSDEPIWLSDGTVRINITKVIAFVTAATQAN